MKKDNIIQFVGFITELETEEFLTAWEYYSKELMIASETTSLQQETEKNGRFKYISQHELHEGEGSFVFTKDKNSKYLKEQKIKIVYVGGYIPVQIGCNYNNETSDVVKILAFLRHDVVGDIEFYRQLVPYRYLNIYQEYYENCQYSHIMEFFTDEKDAPDLITQLSARTGTLAAIYKECATAKI